MSSSGQQVLLIISPYIGSLDGEASRLKDVANKTQSERGRMYVITREPKNDYHIEGLDVLEREENVEIRYNSDVHAKLYISWNCNEEESFAMFGSGKLTSAGMKYSLELGMLILSRGYGRKLVRELYRWGDNLRTQSKKGKRNWNKNPLGEKMDEFASWFCLNDRQNFTIDPQINATRCQILFR